MFITCSPKFTIPQCIFNKYILLSFVDFHTGLGKQPILSIIKGCCKRCLQSFFAVAL